MFHCPTLAELPPPPPDRSGWPWTKESPQLPEIMPDGSPWPCLTIVTPSFNQGKFIEETIRSVLLQGYPNMEYIIVDGGSTDNSLEIIKKYERWLTYWVSEPDTGQSDALNKGFQRSTGSIVAWLNSDDTYLPDILQEPVIELLRDPELVFVYGDCYIVDEEGKQTSTWKTRQATAYSLLMKGNKIPQMSTFIRATALAAVGGVERELQYVMDYALWLRLSLVGTFRNIPRLLSNFRGHCKSKSVTALFFTHEEWLDWLSKWGDLGLILSKSDQAEMFRRQHVMAAVYALLEGKEVEAASHFDLALQDGSWPYGDVGTLTQELMRLGTMARRSMQDSWERYEVLMRALRMVGPATMRRRLRRHIASQYHLLWAIRILRADDLGGGRVHLIQALWYDVCLLKDRMFLSNAAQAFLGRRAANWLGCLVGQR